MSTGGSRFAGVDVADNDYINVQFLFTVLKIWSVTVLEINRAQYGDATRCRGQGYLPHDGGVVSCLFWKTVCVAKL